MTRAYAVLGRDVSRSLSPSLHTRAARALSIDLRYGARSCPTEADFLGALDDLRRGALEGANVTIPYKEAAARAARVLDPIAAEIGAVNCLTRTPSGALSGSNTDAPALLHLFGALPPGALDRVQILGSGGAARAAAWALREAGAGSIRLSARDPVRALEVARIARAEVGPLAPLEGATLVVSALPPDPGLAAQALEQWIAVADRPQIYDLAYGALTMASTTPLIALARARSLEGTDGLAMLVEQAARAFATWTGIPLPEVRIAMGPGFDTHPGEA